MRHQLNPNTHRNQQQKSDYDPDNMAAATSVARALSILHIPYYDETDTACPTSIC